DATVAGDVAREHAVATSAALGELAREPADHLERIGVHEADLARLLAEHLLHRPAEDRLGLRRPALHADVGGPLDDPERRVLDVGRELFERAAERVVRALELLDLER